MQEVDSKRATGTAHDKRSRELLNRAASPLDIAAAPLSVDERKGERLLARTRVLLAPTIRWRFPAVANTVGFGAVIFLPLTWMSQSPTGYLVKVVQGPENNIISIGSGLLLGFLIGCFGEREEKLPSDDSAIGRLANHIHKSVTPDHTITAFFNELFGAFKPAQVQLAVHEVATRQIHVWQRDKSDAGRDTKLVRREIDFSYRDQLFFGDNGSHLLGTRLAELDTVFQVRVFKPGKTISERPYTVTNILFPNGFKSFVCIALVFGHEWEARIFLWEPAARRLNRRGVLAVAEACGRLAPMIFAAALQEYLGSRAAAEERARFARELHDGIMQSLAVVDLRMTAIAEQLGQELPERGKDLVLIQQTLRGEVSNLRELIRRNRLSEVAPARLLPFLSETVNRFQRDVGIGARFICELDEVDLPPAIGYEVARIVQEALTNVRKHSGAKNVAVRFNQSHDQYVLVITDDGHGFDFAGHYTFSELDANRKGPFVIKERVRAISGDITIESFPERGTRIEIAFPMERK